MTLSLHAKKRSGRHETALFSRFSFASLLFFALLSFLARSSESARRDDTFARRRRGEDNERRSFWQTRACDGDWGSWPRACYEPFPGDKLQQLRGRKRAITVWTTEIHPGMQRELEALETFLRVPLKLEYRDLWQIVKVARSCDDKRRGCELPAPGNGVNITKLYYEHIDRAVDVWRGCPRPRELRRQVFEAFTQNPEALAWSGLARADLLYFSAPVVPFELFLPFDLPMIVQAPYGFELGRDLPQPGGEYYWDTVASWKAASRCGKDFSAASSCSTPKMMASQSPYDVQVMRYVTGEAPPRLPCHGIIHAIDYEGAESKAVTVAFGSRDYEKMRETLLFLRKSNWPWANASAIFKGIPGAEQFDFRGLRKPFSLKDLARQGALVLIPYKPAINFFLEIYSMNLPVFVPSPQFYAELDRDYKLSIERRWWGGTPESSATGIKHRPNDTESFEANKYWNSFADHYSYPHIVLFDSWSDLVEKLSSANFRKISDSMRRFNAKRKNYVANKWLSFIYDVHLAQRDRRFVPSEHWKSMAATTFDAQMKRTFGLRLGRDASVVLAGCDEDFALGRFDDSRFRGSVEPYYLDYNG